MGEQKPGNWFNWRAIGLSAGPAILTYSVVYESGFFITIGTEFLQFYSIDDFFSLVLVHAPFTVLLFVGLAILELTTVRIERGLSEEEIARQSANPTRTRLVRRLPIELAYWLLVGVALSSVFSSSPHPDSGWAILSALAVTYVRGVVWFFSEERLYSKVTDLDRRIITFAPAILIFTFGTGVINGNRLVETAPTQATVKVAGSSQDYFLIRALKDGYLVSDANASIVSFIPSSQAVVTKKLKLGELEDAKTRETKDAAALNENIEEPAPTPISP